MAQVGAKTMQTFVLTTAHAVATSTSLRAVLTATLAPVATIQPTSSTKLPQQALT